MPLSSIAPCSQVCVCVCRIVALAVDILNKTGRSADKPCTLSPLPSFCCCCCHISAPYLFPCTADFWKMNYLFFCQLRIVIRLPEIKKKSGIYLDRCRWWHLKQSWFKAGNFLEHLWTQEYRAFNFFQLLESNKEKISCLIWKGSISPASGLPACTSSSVSFLGPADDFMASSLPQQAAFSVSSELLWPPWNWCVCVFVELVLL